MKKRTDPRHLHRIKIMQELFSWNFQLSQNTTSQDVKKIINNIGEIDKILAQSAPQRPLNQINKIDLAILRLAIFELIMEKETPPKVILDEAIELAKEFGSDSSPSFVNGALGQAVKIKGIKIKE